MGHHLYNYINKGKQISQLLKKSRSKPRQRNLKTNDYWSFSICVPGENSSLKSRDYRNVIVFENVFRPRENAMRAFSKSSGLKSVFESSVFGTD